MTRIITIFSILILTLVSCKKEKKVSQVEYNSGNLTILTDDSFHSVVEGLAQAYMINYPSTNLKVEVKKEDLAFLDILNNNAKIIAISKPLNDEEKKAYKDHTGFDFHIDYFAVDAVLFVVGKNSTRKTISMEEIKKELLSDSKNIIFDGNNSSNLNFVARTLGYEPSALKYSTIVGNKEVAAELEKYPNKIGVISLNTISRPYHKASQELKSKINILSVQKDGVMYLPENGGLGEMKYPFSRMIYFLTNENGFGIAKGFLRFACTQLGQKVVNKEGLQPYYLYKREVQMSR